MKSVLISIQPYWVDLIARGEKTIEVRKTKPKLNAPFKVYIYCTQDKYVRFANRDNWDGNGKVIGEFVCDAIEHYTSNCTVFESVLLPSPSELEEMCLTLEEFNGYGTRGKLLYGWHISDLVIYDEPKELSEFVTHCKYEFDDDFEHCENCQHYYYSNTPSCGIEEYCGCDGLKPVTRPPQSWCYVEERSA